MIIQFGANLTSENNSQNRGDSCSNIYPGFRTAKPRQRQKISYPNLSDLLNYTLNLRVLNIAFHCAWVLRFVETCDKCS